MKLDDRFDALARTRTPDLWHEISERDPRGSIEDQGPSRLRRVGIAILALTVAGAGFAYAVEAFEDRSVPGSSPTPTILSVAPAVTLGVTDTIDLAEFPNAVVAGEGAIWVSAPANDGSGAGDVVRIDPVTTEIAARIPVEALPSWETGGGGMAVGLGSVWVSGTLFGSGSGGPGGDDAVVTVIDPNTNDVSDVVDLGPGSGADVWVDDFHIWALVFTPNHEGLEVVRVDSVTHDVVARVPIDGIWSQQVWTGEGAAWVNAHQPAGDSVVGASTLTKIDPLTNEVVATREGTTFVESIEPNDGLLWAWVHEGLVQIDAVTLEPVGEPIEIPGGHDPFVVDGSGGAWFYGYDNDADAWFVSRVSLETGMVDATVELGPDTQDNRWWLVAAALDPPTSTVWAVHYRQKVSRISVS